MRARVKFFAPHDKGISMNEQKLTLRGASGREYSYFVFPIGAEFKAEPGNYMFTKLAWGKHEAKYAGETHDLSARFDYHHKMPCILREGATHVLAHLSSASAAERRAEEQDIIRAYSPTCNG